MRLTAIATVLCLFSALSADAAPQASSPDEIDRALGGDHWRHKSERAPTPPSAADAAKRAQREAAPLDVEARGAGGGLTLPIYDMDVECGLPSKQNIGRNTCLELEQSSYDSLQSLWDDLPIDIKDKCRDFPTYKGVRYRRIAICVSNELDMLKFKSDQTEHRRFRY